MKRQQSSEKLESGGDENGKRRSELTSDQDEEQKFCEQGYSSERSVWVAD